VNCLLPFWDQVFNVSTGQRTATRGAWFHRRADRPIPLLEAAYASVTACASRPVEPVFGVISFVWIFQNTGLRTLTT
jgi:hypothetical protein